MGVGIFSDKRQECGIIIPQNNLEKGSPKSKRTGNYKAGPGRPPGSKNKKTLAFLSAIHSFRTRPSLETPGDEVVSVSAPELAALVVFPAPRDLDARFAGVFFETTGV